MISVETKRDGKSLRVEEVPACEIDLPPFSRSVAAAAKVKELMSKESITLDEALKRPEVEQAAREADIAQPVATAQPEIDDDALIRRYRLSILNQRRETFDDLSDDEIDDMIVHPRFANLNFLTFQTWLELRKG